MADTLRILVLGDVVGPPGCRALFIGLADLVRRLGADLVIANGGERRRRVRAGPGGIADRLFACGVHVITSGNHIWQRREILPMLDARPELLRPENYPPRRCPGQRALRRARVKDDCPSPCSTSRDGSTCRRCATPSPSGARCCGSCAGRRRASASSTSTPRASRRRRRSAAYLDGEASAVFGTHTHVQTADERILAKGTAYHRRHRHDRPRRGGDRHAARDGHPRSAQPDAAQDGRAGRTAPRSRVACITVDARTGRATAIERVRERSAV